MATILPQYSGFQNVPPNQLGGLSPLQLAAAYYMIQGQQVPFFINHDWLRALRQYCDSGILDPKQVGGTGPVVVKVSDVYTIETAPDCGPDGKNLTELVYRGKTENLPVSAWRSGVDGIVRGGSAANGVGGTWGTGGITGPSPDPGNSVNQPDPIVSNVAATYSMPDNLKFLVTGTITDPDQFNSNIFGGNPPVSVQGIG